MTVSAVHLEMRDAYTPRDEGFLDWKAGKPVPVVVKLCSSAFDAVWERAVPHADYRPV